MHLISFKNFLIAGKTERSRGHSPYQRDLPSGVLGPDHMFHARLAKSSVIVTLASRSEHSIEDPIKDKASKLQRPGKAITPSLTPSSSSHAVMAAFFKASKTHGGGDKPRSRDQYMCERSPLWDRTDLFQRLQHSPKPQKQEIWTS